MQNPSSAGDEKFTELICAYEENLTENTEARSLDESVLNEDHDLAERLQAATRGLNALDRVRRRWNPDAKSVSSESGQLPDTIRDQETQPLKQQSIGRFQIQRELGRGGVGVVFLGYDPKLRRQIALKVPGEEALASADMRARFLREAEASARLDHPNVVSVFEVGEAGPLCYIASEYCSGPTLRQRLRQSPMPVDPRLAAKWTVQLAEAVQHAHGRGVLHRDIKPSNILLATTQQDTNNVPSPQATSELIPKLADFGMAKLLEPHEPHDATRSGTLIGTIPYMAPEQAEGLTSQIDVRTDVYGLGAMLYEMLTQRPPYSGDSDASTLRQLLFTQIVPPSQYGKGIPRDLEAICLKCLDKNPERRYGTAQELSDDLRRFLRGQPTEVRPPRVFERIAMWVRRRPAAAAVSAIGLFAMITLFAVIAFYSARLGSALKQTEFERSRAEREALTSGQLLYSANVRLASDALTKANREEAMDLLEHHLPVDGQPDQREFAWHLLWQQCNPKTHTLMGHEDEVFSVAFSPDGNLLASASKDGTARLWELSTGKTRFELKGHTSEVTSVAFHPDGNRVATGSEDHSVRIWHAATGKLVGVLDGHTDHVLCVAYSPDGDWLATGGRDATIRIWDTHSLDAIEVIENLDGNVRALDFSRDGELLAALESGSLLCFDVADWNLNYQEFLEGEALFGAEYSHDLPWIAAAGRQKIGRVFKITSTGLEIVAELEDGHTEWIQRVAFSPRDNSLVTAGKGGVIQLWSVGNSVSNPLSLMGHEGRVWDAAWSPDGRQLASCGADHSIKIWDLESLHTPLQSYPCTSGEINNIAFSPDGKRLFTSDRQGVLRVWDPQTRQLTKVIARLGVEITALSVSTDGEKLAVIDFAGRTHLWNLKDWSHDLLMQSSEGFIDCLAWSPDGRELAVTRNQETVVIFDARTGQERFHDSAPEEIEWIQYLDTANRLVVCSDMIRVVDLTDGAIQPELKGMRHGCISHDNKTLALWEWGHTVELWDLSTSSLRQRLIGNTDQIVGRIAFSPDDRTVAVGDKTHVTLWDARTGQILTTFKIPSGVSALAFSPCGQHLTCTSRARPGQIVQWSLSPERNNSAAVQESIEHASPRANHLGESGTRSFVVEFAPQKDLNSTSIRSFRIEPNSPSVDAKASGPPVLAELDVRYGSSRLLGKTSFGVTACAVGDIDLDGDLDIAAANFKSDRIFWYANDGLGNFSTIKLIDRDTLGAEDLVLSDLDHDGWLEFIAPSNGLNAVRTYGTRVGSSKSKVIQSIREIDRPHALICADLNGDGHEDVIWAERGKDRVGCALNEAGKSLKRVAEISVEAGSGETLAAADFDQDGDLDILASSNLRGMLVWIENDGQGLFPKKHVLLSYRGSSRNPDVADLDNDGDVDVVVPFLEEDRLVLLENLQNGQFLVSQLPTIPGTGPCSVTASDLDGDSDFDLVVGGRNEALITVYLNDGSAGFTRSSRTVNTSGESIDDVEVTDLNSDGRPDIVFAGYRGPGLGWHECVGVAFSYRTIDSQELKFDPWNRNGFAVSFSHNDPQQEAPAEIQLQLATAEGRLLESEEFSRMVEGVRVYRDVNRNGLAESQWEPIVAEIQNPIVRDGVLRIPCPTTATLATPHQDQMLDSGQSLPYSDLMASVNRWATTNGHVAALPIFNGRHRGNSSHTDTVVASLMGCKLVELTLDDLHAANALPLSDHNSPDTLYAQNTSSIDVWARAHGYKAGILMKEPEHHVATPYRYRALVFFASNLERKSMSMTELDYPVGFEELCQKVQEQAETLGHVAGFPVFVSDREIVECILMGEDLAKREKARITNPR